MAAVFLMQPLGQLSATLIGYGVTKSLCQKWDNETDKGNIALCLDQVWRIVIGVGAIPALLAVMARLSIPESPRFILDVLGDADEAVDTLKSEGFVGPRIETSSNVPRQHLGAGNSQFGNGETFNSQVDNLQREQLPNDGMQEVDIAAVGSRPDSRPVGHSSVSQQNNSISQAEQQTLLEVTPESRFQAPQYRRPKSWNQYFYKEGNWTSLVGTSLAWFCLDFVFYGLGINNPRTIAKIWADHIPPLDNSTSPSLLFWQDPYNPNNTIYEVLQDDARQSMITISIGSLLGSLLLVFCIDYIPRKLYLIISFGILTGLFAIVGSTFLTSTFGNGLHGVTITLYVLCQLFFNFGKSNHISIPNQKGKGLNLRIFKALILSLSS